MQRPVRPLRLGRIGRDFMRTSTLLLPLAIVAILALPLGAAHDCNSAGTISYDRNHDQVCPSVITICVPGHLCVSVANVQVDVRGLLP